MTKPYKKENATLWLNKYVLDIGRVGLWRVIWGKPDRIILEFDLPLSNLVSQLFELPSFDLDLFTREHGRRDTSDGAIHIMTFKNCRLHRRWMTRPILLYAEVEIMTAFAEFTCEIVEVNMQEELTT